MTTVTGSASGLDAELLQRLGDAGPSWLADERRAAWRRAEALPMPSSARDEDWRRTDIRALHLESFTQLQTVDPEVIDAMRHQRDRAAPDAAFIVDAPVPEPVRDADALLAQGVIVSSFEEAATRHPELAQQALRHAGVEETKFDTLWRALWCGGAFIHVPAGVDALVPVWVAHPASGERAAIFPTTVVQLQAGASLTVIDAFASPAAATELFSDTMVLLDAARDSRLNYAALQQWGDGTWHMARHRAILGSNARLRFFGATLGARLQKAYWDVVLDGAGAEADVVGVCFGDGRQHLDHQSLQDHRAPDTRSNLLLKVAVRDESRSVYSGLIEVAPEAVHADGYVQNRNLILSHGAKADAVPRLEIRANDVRCGHGATAGHIDPEQRFYAMSRGVAAEDADALIVGAFLEDAVSRIAHEGLRALVAELLEAEVAGRPQAGIAGMDHG